MNDLYMLCGISKQGHTEAIKQYREVQLKIPLYVNTIIEGRALHPMMGLRTIYDTFEPQGIGRDAFILLGKNAGYQLKQDTNSTRTTFSVKSSRYRNLLEAIWFTDINQIWTSDITYYRIAERFYYIVFIMDVYSRRIIGYHVADNMRAENNIHALQMALTIRGIRDFEKKLIHHSDRGSQYVSNDYTDLLNDHGIQISMCRDVLENAHIERVNGTIKNYYLSNYNISNFNDLVIGVAKAVKIYNENKPHSALRGLTPCNYETQILSIKLENRYKFQIYTLKQNVLNSEQLEFNFNI
jgi:putative transposase